MTACGMPQQHEPCYTSSTLRLPSLTPKSHHQRDIYSSWWEQGFVRGNRCDNELWTLLMTQARASLPLTWSPGLEKQPCHGVIYIYNSSLAEPKDVGASTLSLCSRPKWPEFLDPLQQSCQCGLTATNLSIQKPSDGQLGLYVSIRPGEWNSRWDLYGESSADAHIWRLHFEGTDVL